MRILHHVIIDHYAHTSARTGRYDYAAPDEDAGQKLGLTAAPSVRAPPPLAFGLYEYGDVADRVDAGEEVHTEIVFGEIVSFVFVIVVVHTAAYRQPPGEGVADFRGDVYVSVVVVETESDVAS